MNLDWTRLSHVKRLLKCSCSLLQISLHLYPVWSVSMETNLCGFHLDSANGELRQEVRMLEVAGWGGGGGSIYSLCSPCRDLGVWVFPTARVLSSPGWPSPHSLCSQVQNCPSFPDSGGSRGLTLLAPGTALSLMASLYS